MFSRIGKGTCNQIQGLLIENLCKSLFLSLSEMKKFCLIHTQKNQTPYSKNTLITVAITHLNWHILCQIDNGCLS